MLELNQIQKAFGGVTALASVDLSVSDGEFVSLVGPNGAGKTTLINIITGALRPDGGQVLLDGQSLNRVPAYKRSRYGVVRTFQSPRMFRRLTVRQNILASPRVHAGANNEDFDEIVEALQLTSRLDARTDELNVVDRHRIEIARAILMQPSLLLLDEPTAGMAESEARHVINVISARQSAAGFGILLIEHNFRLVKEVSDRLAVLDFGRLIHTGPPAEVEKNERVVEAYLGKRS